MRHMSLSEIKQVLCLDTALSLQEEGFKLYSSGKVQVPPVGYLNFGKSDVHIKSAWMEGEEVFAVKIIGHFPQDALQSPGSILVFDVRSGQLKAYLQDEGYLTHIRTAMAGLLAAKHLAPKDVRGIGILGTGIQARLQAEFLARFTPCRTLWVWGRNSAKAMAYAREMEPLGFQVKVANAPAEVARHCNLIATTTASRSPLLSLEDIRPGTHITAVGADAPGKQELDPQILRRADLVVVDSRKQCLDHGEMAYVRDRTDLIELGQVLLHPELGRKSHQDITVADLTGLGVQDLQIAKAVAI